jgi:hypothetical protein
VPQETEAATEDLFEMANLFPVTTGLPMTALVAYWDGQIDTIQLGHLLQRVQSAP